MRFTRTAILAGGAALLVAGTAAAAEKLHTMNVALPDGSVAQIHYSGDVAPQVTLQPVDAVPVAYVDPFAEFEQMAAYMEAQQQAMMQQAAAMQQAATKGGAAAVPAGVQYTYVSSTTDANGCTQTVQYSSDGSGAEPQVTRTSAGSCDKAVSDAPVQTSAVNQPEPQGPGTKV